MERTTCLRTSLSLLALFIALLVFTVPVANAFGNATRGEHDYPARPDSEIRFTALEVHLEAGFDEKTIRGTASYRFQPRHAYLENLSLSAPGMQIRDLTLNGEQVPYQKNGDTLRIPLEEYPDPDREHILMVSYVTTPVFGLHFRHNGTIVSSTLPGSTVHWLPGPSHPWAAMPVVTRLEVPANLTGVASGALERQTSTDKGQLFVFRTGGEVPFTDLFLAVGAFEVEDSFSGTKNLRVYSEQGTLDRSQVQEHLAFLTRRVRDYERLLQSEMPARAFHVIILSDDMWETRPYHAGAAVVHGSSDEIRTLMVRSLAAQWFGIALRPEQWQKSSHITMLQALAAEKLGESDWEKYPDPVGEVFAVPVTIYQQMSMHAWQQFRDFLRQKTMPILLDVTESSLTSLAARRGVLTSYEFSALVYEKTGLWIEIPEKLEPEPESDLRYRVTVDEVRGSDRLLLTVEPLNDITEKELEMRVSWIRDGEIRNERVTFSGRGDQLEISPGGFINNIWVEAANDETLELEMRKPFSYWLHQLRRDERPERRIEAALALKDHSRDPDLQLAVQDHLNREQDPGVLAAMHRLMAELTTGASGTERRFLDGITSNEAKIRIESMKALRNYRNNPQVENQVLSVIQTSDDITLVNEAIRTYRWIIQQEDFREFAIRFLREDRQDLLFTKTLIEELFETGSDDSVVATVREYLNPGYSFRVRWLAYRQLRQHAADAGWQQNFLRDYSDDPDPRIRFIALFSVPALNYEERGPFLEARMLVEYDIRILKQACVFAASE
jgi:hypothetical protein